MKTVEMADIAAAREKFKTTALQSLGSAVLVFQAFEQAFALVYLNHRTALSLGNDFSPEAELPPPDFKTPTASHIGNLETAGRIDASFAQRLRKCIEKRHDLIHRWTIVRGWAKDDDTDKWADLIAACDLATSDCKSLLALLSARTTRFDGESDANYSARQADVFKIAANMKS